MSICKGILDTFAEFGSEIKDATVELGEDMFEIITEDIPRDLAEIGNDAIDAAEEAGNKAISKVEEIIDNAADIATTEVAVAVVTAVVNIFKKIK